MKKYPRKAFLILEDGTVFEGESFGAEGTVVGEVCFNTSMTGYQEILTDPSYRGQIVCLTYPEIGNYGINPFDHQSRAIQVSGLVIRSLSPVASNWRSFWSLPDFLKNEGVMGIQKVDTRRLTLHLREAGVLRGVLTTEDMERKDAMKLAHGWDYSKIDFIAELTTPRMYRWNEEELFNPIIEQMAKAIPLTEGKKELIRKWREKLKQQAQPSYRLAVLDFGVKFSTLRYLRQQGFDLYVFPAYASSQAVLDIDPDGIFLSNGPGDPALFKKLHAQIKPLLGKKPIFGICLGHQLLAIALGAQTFKLRFGHRGANHPVKNLFDSTIKITSQNHGYAVSADTLPEGLKVSEINLSDGTIEGFVHESFPLFSVQYHPEASPGPHDALSYFEFFFNKVKGNKT
ncbi:glutamine-hydrolyzing carbamoyl-phosphate synthase small subunit [Methylacidiphilum caldifontis]|uniref:Carbamoyl phosphate synthase small chain n=1 Tax=Methylacidiphilum caldifontis TaxID=2795386 RepID=A0A4Y8P8G5_9BACT|nr:glutamine-hydrolyzing carbamoyl-phosphate synthase small subunit [Methylacidiphilum caldifontis]TFE66544.1 carbamoyl phosphate synthase small subunit [Methylacidiphilum caldifontis]